MSRRNVQPDQEADHASGVAPTTASFDAMDSTSVGNASEKWPPQWDSKNSGDMNGPTS